VREELRVSRSKVSDGRLWSLWMAIDENENGFICAGELHRFMKGSLMTEAAAQQTESKMVERAQEQVYASRQRAEVWARDTAAKARAHGSHSACILACVRALFSL
jgi:hypothetical protein